jgi:hypothetical protein
MNRRRAFLSLVITDGCKYHIHVLLSVHMMRGVGCDLFDIQAAKESRRILFH